MANLPGAETHWQDSVYNYNLLEVPLFKSSDITLRSKSIRCWHWARGIRSRRQAGAQLGAIQVWGSACLHLWFRRLSQEVPTQAVWAGVQSAVLSHPLHLFVLCFKKKGK